MARTGLTKEQAAALGEKLRKGIPAELRAVVGEPIANRMKNRQIFYATALGKSAIYEGKDLVTVDDIAAKSRRRRHRARVALI